ncbi:MAG: S-layer homology domain-containing protein [Firmicutes bacterium]|nr:S-layer homology domain-containing protein [Bacillota bacterium]
MRSRKIRTILAVFLALSLFMPQIVLAAETGQSTGELNTVVESVYNTVPDAVYQEEDSVSGDTYEDKVNQPLPEITVTTLDGEPLSETDIMSIEAGTVLVVSVDGDIVKITITCRIGDIESVQEYVYSPVEHTIVLPGEHKMTVTAEDSSSNQDNKTIDLHVETPAVTFTSDSETGAVDTDNVYYYRGSDSDSDTLSFELSNLAQGSRYGLEFGYLDADDELIVSGAVYDGVLYGEETSAGTYMFSTPIMNDNNNSMHPLWVQLNNEMHPDQPSDPFPISDGDGADGEVDDGNDSYVNVNVPDTLVDAGYETKDLSGEDDLTSISDFYFSNEYGKIEFAGEVDILSYLEAYKQLDEITINIKKGSIIFDTENDVLAQLAQKDSTVTMYDLTHLSVPNVRVYDENNEELEDVVDTENTSYDSDEGILNFVANHSGEEYFARYEANYAPTVENEIPDQEFQMGEEIELDLGAVFNDADGDKLNYTIENSTPDKVSVTASENALTLVPVSPGESTVTVTAGDGNDSTVADEFEVQVNPSENSDNNDSSDNDNSNGNDNNNDSDSNNNNNSNNSSDNNNSGNGGSQDGDATGTEKNDGSINLSDNTETNIEVDADGRTVVTVRLDEQSEVDYIKNIEGIELVVIEVTEAADTVRTKIPSGVIDNLAAGGVQIEIRTPVANYTVPAQELLVQVKKVAARLGVDIGQVEVTVVLERIGELRTKEIGNAVAAQTNGRMLIQPVEFRIEVTAGDETVEVNSFGSYVNRSMVLPDIKDIDGVFGMVMRDGKLNHIPTRFVPENGGIRAVLSSRTNSTYTIIANEADFRDIAGHWAENDIKFMAAGLMVKGMGDGKFIPSGKVTRAEFAAFLMRALGMEEKTTNAGFKDVSSDDWYAGVVASTVDADLVSGYPENQFKPNAKISRQEMAVIITRALDMMGFDATSSEETPNNPIDAFSDSSAIDEWAEDSVKVAVQAGIMKGMSGGNFSPDSNATRAQGAVVIKRMMDTIGLQ